MARGLGTRGRFAVAYLLLGAAVGIAVGGAIVLVNRTGPQPRPPWSSWQPTTSSTSSREFEIAQHVARSYKQPTGDQLVASQGRRLAKRKRLRRGRDRQAERSAVAR